MEWKKIGLLLVYLGVAMAAHGQWLHNVEPTDIDPAHRVCFPCSDPKNNRLWFLDRIDQEGLPLDKTYSYCSDGSYYDAGALRHVLVYVVDTGILRDHVEFGATDAERRARIGNGYAIMRTANPAVPFNAVPDPDNGPQVTTPCSTDLIGGHGTSVASFIVGINSGVAKNAQVIPIRLPCNSPASLDPDEDQAASMTFAIGKIIEDIQHKRVSYSAQPAVVSFSRFVLLHPTTSTVFTDLTAKLLELVDLNGVVVTASANNHGEDACRTLPAGASKGAAADPRRSRIIGVGGTMLDNYGDIHPSGNGGNNEVNELYPFDPARGTRDVRWDDGPGDSTSRVSPPSDTDCPAFNPTDPKCNGKFGQTRGSDYGECVALWAPAWNTTSASPTGFYGYRDGMGQETGGSGTSFAAPIAAGVVARFLSMMHTATGDQVRAALLNTAVPNALEVATAIKNIPIPSPPPQNFSFSAYFDLNNGISADNNRLLQASDVMFLQQPTVTSTQPVTIQTTVAAASPNVTYQWYRGPARGNKDLSTAIGGNASTITDTPPNGTSYYWVRVSGTCTATTESFSRDSYLARITLCDGTRITEPVITPEVATFVQGVTQPVTLTVNAPGAGGVSWYSGLPRDNPGNALWTGTVFPVSPSETTTYWVRATYSGNCTADSNVVKVRAVAPPHINSVEGVGTCASPCTFAVFSNYKLPLIVHATGTDLRFEWTVDGTVVGNCKTQQCMVLGPAANQQYDVMVTATNETNVSDQRTITIKGSAAPTPLNMSGVVTTDCSTLVPVVSRCLQLTVENVPDATYDWYEGLELNATSGFFPTEQIAAGATRIITIPVPTSPKLYWAVVKKSSGAGESFGCGPVLPLPRVTTLDSGAIQLFIYPGSPSDQVFWYHGLSGDKQAPFLVGNLLEISNPITGDPYWAEIHTSTGCIVQTQEVHLCAVRRHPVAHTASAGPGEPVRLTMLDTSDNPSVVWYTGSDPSDTTNPVGNGTSIIVAPRQSTTYHAIATSTCDGQPHQDLSDPADVDVACVPPEIEVQPANSALPAGNTAVSASVDARGLGLSYQWYEKDNATNTSTPIVNETAASYTFHPTATKLAQTVYVVVSNGCGTATSQLVTLSVAPPAPAVCTAPHIVAYTSRGLAGVPGEGVHLSVVMDPFDDGNKGYTYQWYRGADQLLPGVTQKEIQVATQKMDTFFVHVEQTCPGPPPTVYGLNSEKAYVKVYDACDLPPLEVTRSADGIDASNSSVTLNAYCDWPGVTFTWYAGEAGDTRKQLPSDPGKPAQLTVSSAKAVWVRASLSCGAQRDSGTLEVATSLCGPVYFDLQPQSTSIAYGDSTVLSAHADTQAKDIDYGWFAGSLTDGLPGQHFATVPVAPLKSTRYFARAVSLGCGTYTDSYTATVRVASCANINITSWPSNAWADSGATATLAVNTAQSGLTFQWFEGEVGDESNPKTGISTDRTFITPPLTADAKYWVRVSNGSCVADSATITVSVCTPPAFGNYQKNFTVVPGLSEWIGSPAAGTAVTYEWFQGPKGDTSQPAGNKPLLYVRPTESTQYWERATSHCGADGSDSRVASTDTITVSVCPSVNTPVAAQTIVMPGRTTTLSVYANGTLLSYQWYIGERGDLSHPIAGATAATITTPPINQPTKFWVAVTSGTCPAYSDDVTVDVCSGTSVSWNSAVPTQVHSGDNVMLLVNYLPVVDTTLYYYRGTAGDVDGSVLLNTSTSAGYSTTALTADTNFWVRAKNGICYADTPTLTVRVCIPTITTQPTGTIVNAGSPADLTVAANTPGLTYQWYEGNAGDTSKPAAAPAGQLATYHFTPAATANYWVRVTGSCGRTADSNVVTVTVCAPPSITAQSPPRIVNRGAATNVSVTATGTNLTYQWYKGTAGVTTTPVSGATGASLNVTADYTTNYWVRVGGYCGTADSGTLSVNVFPIITAQPADVSVTKGTGGNLSVTADANPVSYQWYRGAAGVTSSPVCTNSAACTTPPVTSDTQFWVRITSGLAIVDSTVATVRVCPSPTVSIAQPANQQSGANVTLSVDNPDTTHTFVWYNGTSGNTASPVPNGTGYAILVKPAQTSTYWVRETSSVCSADSATVTVPICTPTITSQPANASINSNQSATLTATVTGTPPLAYQWYTGTSGNTTSPVSGATSNSVTVNPSSTTSYWLQVTAYNGTCGVNSNAATVTVCVLPSISTDPSSPSIQRGQTASIGVTANGTNLSYQWYQGAKGITTTPVGGNSNVLSISPQYTNSYWVRVSGCSTSVDSNAGQVSVAPVINTQPANVRITKNTSATFTVNADASPITYQWYAGASGDVSNLISGATSATYTTPALATDRSYWVKLTSGAAVTASNTATATICIGPTLNVNNPSQTSGSQVTLSIAAPGAGETYSYYAGNSGDTSNPVVLNTQATSWPVTPTQTTSYWARSTTSSCSADGPAASVAICYPKVTTPTGTLGITSGQQTTLRVTATGTPTLTYQWYTGASGNTASPVSGGTTDTVTVQPGSTTSYWVRVTSSAGAGCSTNSPAVTVTVCQLPVITTQPQAQTYPTSTYSRYISVVASGTGLSYQWYEGAAGVTTTPVGANASQIAITPGVTKYYWVRVSNACGSVDSVAALQSVAPTIYAQPADTGVCSGTAATLSVSAGGSSLSYQWYQTTPGTTGDTTHPVGTNSSSFTTPALVSDTAYWVKITSGATYAASNTAVVSITPGPGAGVNMQWAYTTCWILSAQVNGNLGDFYYYWYQGNYGDTSHLIGNYYYKQVCGSGTKVWLRVVDPGTGCASDSGTITIP